MNPTEPLGQQADQLVEQALALRSERKYNCAQAVACALAPYVGADSEAAYRMSEGFGSGMGEMSETCGAISGAIMVLSQASSAGTELSGATKAQTYSLTRELLHRFREQNGSTVCRELKGVGADTGVLRSCPGCIEDAIRFSCAILDERLAQQSA